MLVLQRLKGQSLTISHNGEILVIDLVDISGNRAKIGFSGPRSFVVVREEAVSKSAKQKHFQEGKDNETSKT